MFSTAPLLTQLKFEFVGSRTKITSSLYLEILRDMIRKSHLL